MTYQLQQTKSWGKRITYTSISIAFIIGLYFSRSQISPFLSSITQQAATPILKSGTGIENAISDNLPMLSTKTALVSENRELKNKLAEVNAKLLTYELILKENKNLKILMGRNEEEIGLLSTVLARPNQTPYDTMIIDVGRNKGVEVGDEVLVFNQIAIGTIKEVYEHTAKVVMFSAPGEKINVFIGLDDIPAEATGRGAGNFEISLPKQVEVFEGDIVTAPRLNIKAFGTIDHIELSPGGSFQKILIKLPININDIRWVKIVKPGYVIEVVAEEDVPSEESTSENMSDIDSSNKQNEATSTENQ